MFKNKKGTQNHLTPPLPSHLPCTPSANIYFYLSSIRFRVDQPAFTETEHAPPPSLPTFWPGDRSSKNEPNHRIAKVLTLSAEQCKERWKSLESRIDAVEGKGKGGAWLGGGGGGFYLVSPRQASRSWLVARMVMFPNTRQRARQGIRKKKGSLIEE